jgi:hypothetical protein
VPARAPESAAGGENADLSVFVNYSASGAAGNWGHGYRNAGALRSWLVRGKASVVRP